MIALRSFSLVFGVNLVFLLCLTGCPPDANYSNTTAVATVVSSTSGPDFLEQARNQPLTPAEAALLHIIDSVNFSREEKLEAAKALAEIEKVRVLRANDQQARSAEVERR